MLKRIKDKLDRPNHTWKRFLNSCLNFISKSLRIPFVLGFPELVSVEPTNMCNLKCPLCPTGSGKMRRRQGYLTLENFKKVVDEVGDYIYYMTLSNFGEPFLNEDLIAMIRYAKSKRIVVSLLTNANLIDESNASDIVGSGLDNMIISLDGATQSSYEKYKVGGDLSRAINAVKLIIEKRDERKSKTPFLQIQFIVMRHNEDEIEEIKNLAQALNADRLVFKKLCNLNGFPNDPQEMEEYMPLDTAYRAYKFEDGVYRWDTKIQDPNFCPMAWNYPVINWDGSLYPCCFEHSSFELGNIFESSFKEAWNNKRFISLRRDILKDKGSLRTCSECPVNFYRDIVFEAP